MLDFLPIKKKRNPGKKRKNKVKKGFKKHDEMARYTPLGAKTMWNLDFNVPRSLHLTTGSPWSVDLTREILWPSGFRDIIILTFHLVHFSFSYRSNSRAQETRTGGNFPRLASRNESALQDKVITDRKSKIGRNRAVCVCMPTCHFQLLNRPYLEIPWEGGHGIATSGDPVTWGWLLFHLLSELEQRVL